MPGTDWSRNPLIVRAAATMAAGGVVAYATEAVWGLGVDPANSDAVARLLALKQRPRHKGLILLAADEAQLTPWLQELSPAERQRLAQTWPGAVTWLVPNRGLASRWVTGDFDTVALRVTAHPLAAGLCRAFGGPIVSTSANPQGLPPARTGWKVRQYFGKRLDALAPGQVGGRKNPSQIRDLATGKVIRR